MDIKEALTFEGLKYFYTTQIKPLKTRISQLGGAANCTVVNNATTTTANTVLDGRMGKTIGDRLTAVETRVQNHYDRTGATNYTGYYETNWNLSTTYADIGNSRSIDDKYFKATPGSSSAITVKEGGVYLVQAHAYVHSSSDSKVWGQIHRQDTNIHSFCIPVTGDTTFESTYISYLNLGDTVKLKLSKSDDSSTVTVYKDTWLQLVKLT